MYALCVSVLKLLSNPPTPLPPPPPSCSRYATLSGQVGAALHQNTTLISDKNFTHSRLPRSTQPHSYCPQFTYFNHHSLPTLTSRHITAHHALLITLHLIPTLPPTSQTQHVQRDIRSPGLHTLQWRETHSARVCVPVSQVPPPPHPRVPRVLRSQRGNLHLRGRPLQRALCETHDCRTGGDGQRVPV